MDLTAVLVNYNTAAFARGAVRSVLREAKRLRRGGRPIEVEVIVVDNASPLDDAHALAAIEKEGARVLHHGHNPGYAGGMNHGLRKARGEFVAILNPDLEFLPGALDLLFRAVEEGEDVGAAGPMTYLDRGLGIRLPRNHIPSLWGHIVQTGAHLFPSAALRYAARRSRAAHAYWTAAEPVDLDMLSGCCILARRSVLESIGCFDETYPLYYEDADLFRRLREKGYRLRLVPGAGVVHFWSRSVATAQPGEPMRRFAAAQRHFFRKFYGVAGYPVYLACQAAIALWPSAWRMRPFAPVQDLGSTAEPPTIRLPRPVRAFLAEICGDPMFLLAGGAYGSGDAFEFPAAGWRGLGPARYYVRILDLDGFDLVGLWSVTKTAHVEVSPALDEPRPIEVRGEA